MGGGMSHRDHHDPSWGFNTSSLTCVLVNGICAIFNRLSSQAISIQLWLGVCIPKMEPVTFYQFVKETWVMSSGFIGDPEAGAVGHGFGRSFSGLGLNTCS
ncbi:MAG: hypothetical protein WBO24_17440 [Nitrospirales bacterium]